MRGTSPNAPTVLVLALACLPGGCNLPWTGASLNAWVANEMVPLTTTTPKRHDPLIYDADRTLVRLFGGGNETLAFQVVVQAGDAPIEGLRVAFSDLTTPGGRRIPAKSLQAFRMAPVRVDRYPAWYLRLVDRVPAPADFYDALVPTDAPKAGQPYRIRADERMALWVDVSIPRDAQPGEYTGQMALSTGGGGSWSLALELKVYDFVLPDARSIITAGGFDHRDLFAGLLRRGGKPFVPVRLAVREPLVRRGLVALRKLMRLAHDHRLDLFDKGLRPVLKRDPNGKVRLDWSDYDAVAKPYLDGSAFDDQLGNSVWISPVSDRWPDPADYGGRTPRYQRTLAEAAAAADKHLRALGADKRSVWWPYRGAVEPAGYARYVPLARAIRSAAPEAMLLTHLPAEAPPPAVWDIPRDFEKLSDLRAMPGQWMRAPAGPAGPERPADLTRVWLSPGAPPAFPGLGVIAHPTDVRALPWIAAKYGVGGLFLPEVLHWEGDPFAPAAKAPTRLFYPGTPAGIEGPLPSVRLKRLRRGMQDVTYLTILRLRQRGQIARIAIDALVRYAGRDAAGDHVLDPRLDGWAQRAVLWQEARRILAEEVELAVHPDRASPHRQFALRVAWRTFNEKAHDVRVEQVRSRVLAFGGPDETVVLRAELRVDLWNAHARKTALTAQLGPLAPGWKPVVGKVDITLDPDQRHTVVLSAEGAAVPPTTDGKLPMPVTLKTEHRPARMLRTSAPILLARRAAGPIRIDGKLDDWPRRACNSAGTFRLVGRRGRRGDGLARLQTQATVLRDDQTLYFAVRCNQPDPSALIARSDNRVRYQQLMACGEDLIEILLDPGADGESAEDLYHVVVKANGVVVAERGVGTTPPLGKTARWASGIKAAVGKDGQAWLVELSIPLSAFGPEAEAAAWGVNIARFAPQGAESSSWAGAARYFYHPKNLGTLYVNPPRPR